MVNTNNKTIAIHQPNFLPWLGNFYKIANADQFIFYDSTQFSKGSYTNRVRIHHSQDLNQGFDYLTLAIKKHSLNTAIKDIEISGHLDWFTYISNKITQTYCKANHFHQIEDLLDYISKNGQHHSKLALLNIDIIQYICQKISIHNNFTIASNLDNKGHSTEALIHLLQQSNARYYLSGHGAKSYLNLESFEQHQISLRFSNFKEKFDQSSFDNHFYDKSILSYLAYYSYEEVYDFLVSN